MTLEGLGLGGKNLEPSEVLISHHAVDSRKKGGTNLKQREEIYSHHAVDRGKYT